MSGSFDLSIESTSPVEKNWGKVSVRTVIALPMRTYPRRVASFEETANYNPPVRTSHSASERGPSFLCSRWEVEKREVITAFFDTGRTRHFRASM